VAFTIWTTMLDRCQNPNAADYARYGGRGIDVCARWQGDFGAFYLDMGDRPSAKHSIDRIDNDKGYWCGHPACPECGSFWREPNCRWATSKEQSRNRRTNRLITHNGWTQCLAAWAEEVSTAPGTILMRIRRGWSVARALATPAG
jgi:hypothetical protein